MSYYKNYFDKIYSTLTKVDENLLNRSIELINNIHERDGKIILIGNGGSAAIASHVSVDFTKTAGIRAINFNEADLITCLSNDFGYENWVEYALDYYADSKDLVIIISSSGMSKNIINGSKKAKELKIPIITFSGFNSDNILRTLGDINFWVDNQEYNIVEMTHHIWLLAIVDRIITEKFFNNRLKGEKK